jgi:hypothetical protein
MEGREVELIQDSTLNVVRDSPGGIGDVVHELPPRSTSDDSQLTYLDGSNR